MLNRRQIHEQVKQIIAEVAPIEQKISELQFFIGRRTGWWIGADEQVLNKQLESLITKKMELEDKKEQLREQLNLTFS